MPFHVGTLALPTEYDSTCASFGPPESTTETANRSVQPFLHSSRDSFVGYTGATCRIRLKLCTLAQPAEFKRLSLFFHRIHNPNSKSIGSAVSAQLTAVSLYTLQWATLSPKITPAQGGSGPTYFMIPWASPSPKTKWHHDRFSCFRTSDCRVSLYFTMGCPFPPQNCPLPWGIWTPIQNMLPRTNQSSLPKRHLDQFTVFAGLTSVTDRPTDGETTPLGR